MKKIIAALGLVFLFVPSWAQEASFMGIPIKGSVTEFAKKLIENTSFMQYYEDRNGIILSGKYVQTSCLLILKSEQNHKIKEVDVKFPAANNWKELEERYRRLKGYLTDEYSAPVFSEERFLYNDYPALRFHKVLEGECFYSSEYKLKGEDGYVRLFIKCFTDNTASVVLRYSNGSWSQTKFRGIMEDLSSDDAKTSNG